MQRDNNKGYKYLKNYNLNPLFLNLPVEKVNNSMVWILYDAIFACVTFCVRI